MVTEKKENGSMSLSMLTVLCDRIDFSFQSLAQHQATLCKIFKIKRFKINFEISSLQSPSQRHLTSQFTLVFRKILLEPAHKMKFLFCANNRNCSRKRKRIWNHVRDKIPVEEIMVISSKFLSPLDAEQKCQKHNKIAAPPSLHLTKDER